MYFIHIVTGTTMIPTLLSLTFILFFFIHVAVKSFGKKAKLPSGPWSIPILGHLPLLGPHPPSTILKWTEKYGSILPLKFGSLKVVVLNDEADIRKAFNMPALSGRPFPKLLAENMPHPGLVFAPNLRQAVELRNFVMSNFRSFSREDEDASLEKTISRELFEVEQEFEEYAASGRPFSTLNRLDSHLVNSFWGLMTGKKFAKNDPNLRMFTGFVTENCQVPDAFQLLCFFIPWTSPVLKWFSDDLPRRRRHLDIFLTYVYKDIETHEETRVAGSPPKDFMDSFLDKQKRTTDPTSSFHKSKNSQAMTIFDVFTAGIETASTAMDWIFFLLASHQNVQEELFQEIGQVIGHSRYPSLADRPLMPYTEAVISEMFRFSSFNPFGFMHSALEDVNFEGFLIPKDTLIISNLYGVHHNKQVFENPEQFRPQRFLLPSNNNNNNSGGVEETNVVKGSKWQVNRAMTSKILPFSTGKRKCIGENIANNQIFLYTSRLVQRFRLSIDGPVGDPRKFGFTIKPPPFHLKLNIRTAD